MILFKQNCIPFKGFTAMCLMFICCIRRDWWDKAEPAKRVETLKHENYHCIQWLLWTLFSALIFAIVNIVLSQTSDINLSWWLICLSPIVYYVVYLLLCIPFGYRKHPFEKPAYKHNLSCKCNKWICKYLDNLYYEPADERAMNMLKDKLTYANSQVDALKKQLTITQTNLQTAKDDYARLRQQYDIQLQIATDFEKKCNNLQYAVDELTRKLSKYEDTEQKPEPEPEPEPEPQPQPDDDCKPIGEASIGKNMHVHDDTCQAAATAEEAPRRRRRRKSE